MLPSYLFRIGPEAHVVWRSAVIVGLAGLGACSGPEYQDPVALKPGLYEISATGNGTLFLKNGLLEAQQCLSPTDAAIFRGDPLGTIAYPWERCHEQPNPPRGNALSGERICNPDDQGRPWAHIEFSGSHNEDSFQVKGHVSHPGDGGGMTDFRSGDFSFSGKRVADC
ncbi:MAG: hypothetical protein E6G94_07165 [Alphaproteobacteria bacterium]|nr:MAG: hypothetical protein E6G94_07165 [Alphaproteobacteria bacterium]